MDGSELLVPHSRTFVGLGNVKTSQRAWRDGRLLFNEDEAYIFIYMYVCVL